MKKAGEYLKNIPTFNNSGGYGVGYVLEIIKQVQIDTIEETCNHIAKLTENYNGDECFVLGKQSILNCIEILKKEIE